jgi:hypothetical protein
MIDDNVMAAITLGLAPLVLMFLAWLNYRKRNDDD